MHDSLIDRLRELAQSAATEADCAVYDIEKFSAGKKQVLRLYIDKPDGVTVDDCAKISRQFSLLLDADDIIPGAFTLEVSSPGLTRALKRPDHYRQSLGKAVLIRLRKPMDDRREIAAIISAADDETVSVIPDGESESIKLQYSRINKANLTIPDGIK